MNKNKIEHILDLLKNCNLDSSVEAGMKKYLMTQLESDDKSFGAFLDQFFVLLLNYRILDLRAEAFEMLRLNNTDFTNEMDRIKKDFEALQEGRFPDNETVGSTSEE